MKLDNWSPTGVRKAGKMESIGVWLESSQIPNGRQDKLEAVAL